LEHNSEKGCYFKDNRNIPLTKRDRTQNTSYLEMAFVDHRFAVDLLNLITHGNVQALADGLSLNAADVSHSIAMLADRNPQEASTLDHDDLFGLTKRMRTVIADRHDRTIDRAIARSVARTRAGTEARHRKSQ
jgi:hypothetical protein